MLVQDVAAVGGGPDLRTEAFGGQRVPLVVQAANFTAPGQYRARGAAGAARLPSGAQPAVAVHPQLCGLDR